LRLSDAELRDYCDRFDAVKKGEAGKVNGSQAAAPVTETGAPFVTGEAKPILREPVKPLEGAPLHMLNDYYAAKKRWMNSSGGSSGG
jgi:hypothetical protein